jgi:Mrp family chromosome partitioning ATPase
MPDSTDARTLRDLSHQVVSGLWDVPAELFLGQHNRSVDGLRDGMTRLRHEFDYSIVQAPDAGSSGIAELLAHLSDGLILVLNAHSTRRAVALRVHTNLKTSGVKVLGTVLTGRRFSIPEMLYKRL